MRKNFSLAVLCLIVSIAVMSQDHFSKIGKDSLYIQDSVLDIQKIGRAHV